MSALIPLDVRLWRKVDFTGPAPAHQPDLGPCHLWTGSVINAGYGQINAGIPGKVVMLLVHRVAWELGSGEEVPADRMVLHRCDVRRCVRYPKHLFLGDAKANAQDSIAKGRWPTGPRRKLPAPPSREVGR